MLMTMITPSQQDKSAMIARRDAEESGSCQRQCELFHLGSERLLSERAVRSVTATASTGQKTVHGPRRRERDSRRTAQHTKGTRPPESSPSRISRLRLLQYSPEVPSAEKTYGRTRAAG